MSGAFNIDIECSQGSSSSKLKIFCASLTETWDTECDQVQFAQFHAGLSSEDTIKKNGIPLPNPCPKVDNIDDCEDFLSRLACTAAVLRLSRFHEFLAIPQSVRDGLTYASHKAFGKAIREGYMQRHPRFVRRGGGRMWIRLTKDDRGGSLIAFKNETETDNHDILSSLKLGASTEMQTLKDKGIPNAFVLRSGKRQWVLQASSGRDYSSWQSQLVNMLKEFGPVNIDNNNEEQKDSNNSSDQPAVSSSTGSPKHSARGAPANAAVPVDTGKILKENQELSEKIKKVRQKIANLASEIDRYKDLEIEAKNNEIELKRKGQKQFQKEKEDLIAEYEVKQDNLRGEIEILHQKLEQKTFDEGGLSGLKSLFNEEFVEININDYKQAAAGAAKSAFADDEGLLAVAGSEEAVAGGGLGDDDEDEEDELINEKGASGRYKYLHKHLHRHDHKHIHDHRHTHIHDHTEEPPTTYTHTHTICHTIAHTTTQFKMKRKL
eukprot:CAMPEP_0197022854 /NCGR_PEP_ID=MMETSP1384-20130603/3654_1 /TAXON_ID=29189 /ORGANISM="Ammonia sp." /LENGTH=491 /DNA_ID=CAMNT_0042450965 /DNA_START=61 /DNA_END=1536 /DNA_ORIENTATION=+